MDSSRRARADHLVLRVALGGLHRDLGVELALVVLDDLEVEGLGVGGLEDLEDAPIRELVGRVAVGLMAPPARHGCLWADPEGGARCSYLRTGSVPTFEPALVFFRRSLFGR